MQEKLKKILFPHSKIRKAQDKLIEAVEKSINDRKNLIVHAPTGLGKTAAVLGPALAYALDNDKSVFFLTSRHTQHMIALETLKKIKDMYGVKIICTDIIGKKHMCLQEGIESLYSNDFVEYCKALREDSKCDYYSNLKDKNKLSVKAEALLQDIKDRSPLSNEEIIDMCKREKLCPYEIAMLLAKDSKVVIADYNYIFNPNIRDTFFAKSKKELGNSILIIDEGHNLPVRIRDFATNRLTNNMIERAIKEANRNSKFEAVEDLEILKDVLDKMIDQLEEGKEMLIRKDYFVDAVSEAKDYDEILNNLVFVGDEIREIQKRSYVGSIGFFLEMWPEGDEGFTRIISNKEGNKMISSINLDPSIFTAEIVNNAFSSIMMSGTLTPTSMYKDLLGFDDVVEEEFESPFPKKNRLNLIIPETTTKFTQRSEAQFKNMGNVIKKIVDNVPGNCACFFPSYYLRDQVYKTLFENTNKEILLEDPGMTKEEKTKIMKDLYKLRIKGALLLGTASGSFGEGIDYKGDLLKCVIVVGLPLNPPDLETKELIKYYDEKFSKGWDYGYIFPAFIKSLQNAGRCIRSETDKGVTIFLDERYAWENYYRLFPKDLDVKITKLYEDRVKEFFENKK
jgi:DNA excision repair protein ERCC-2